jgi:hypothetical protein
MRDLLLSLLIQDFPESFFISLVCFSFLCLRWRWRQIFTVTILLTLTNLVRLLPIAFGVHSIILTFLLAVYLNYFTKVPLSKTFYAAVFCLVIITATQFIYLTPLLKIIGLNLDEVLSSPVLRTLITLPYFTVFLTVAIFKHRYNYKRQVFID